jgi:putative DNA primase/helicase
MKTRELTNGFANRFLMIWAERTQVLPFPKATPQERVDEIARRVLDVLDFVSSDRHGNRNGLRMDLSPQAQWRYGQLYRAELNEECGSPLLAALLERRAPMLLRMAMLFALTDCQLRIDVRHIEAAAAWIRHAMASATFVFLSADESARMGKVVEMAGQILEFLNRHGAASRRDITVNCFNRHASKQHIDAAVDYLLGTTPAGIQVRTVSRSKNSPGTPVTVYHIP